MLGPFFIGNRLLLTGYLLSDWLNVEKERLGTRFRYRHAFHDPSNSCSVNGPTEFFPVSH